MLSCSDVHNFLAEQGIPHEIVHLPARSSTAAKAANLLGVQPREVIKSLLFVADGQPVLALVPGDRTVDSTSLSALTSAKSCILARPAQVLEVTGYRRGGVPPCAHATEVQVLADPHVFDPPVVYCGGGTETTMVKIRSEDLRNLRSVQVAELASPAQGGEQR